jgi:DNA-binding beta-propeller fold protein YncE
MMDYRRILADRGPCLVSLLYVLLAGCLGANDAAPSSSAISGVAGSGALGPAPELAPEAASPEDEPASIPTTATLPPGDSPPTHASPDAGTPIVSMTAPPEGVPTLFWLDIYSNTLFRARADGSEPRALLTGMSLRAPDGVAIDPATNSLYVLNMGTSRGGGNDGSLVRMDVTAGMAKTVVPVGARIDGQVFNTGKQVAFDVTSGKLYLADREGSKVWRVNPDGSELEILISGHGVQQIVGVAIDPGNHFYFTDRNGRKVFRAATRMPDGQTHEDRTDLELLVSISRRDAMPLDMEIDLEARKFYWTDKLQGAVFRAGMDFPGGEDASNRGDVETVISGLRDVIGITMDHQNKLLYATHAQAVSRFSLDGADLAQIADRGSTGIVFARIPAGL